MLWENAMLVAPVLAGALPLVVTWLLGGFADFVWIDRPVNFLQSFGILGAMFFPIGGFFFARCGWNEAQANVSRGWPTVSGKVISSTIKQRASGMIWPFTLYRHDLSYFFKVGERSFEGNAAQFGPKWLPSGDLVDRLVEKYPAGAAVTVHYNPDDPEFCVLDTAADLAWQDMQRIVSFIVTPVAISAAVAWYNAIP
jgi:hypothetical protein